MRTRTLILSIIHHSIRLTKALMKLLTRLSIIVLCCLLSFSAAGYHYGLLTVKADNDDEYLTFYDIERESAYRYWAAYGLTADSTEDYLQSYVTTGSQSTSGTFSLSSTGTEQGNINLNNVTQTLYEVYHGVENVIAADSALTNFFNGLNITVKPDNGFDTINVQPHNCQLTGINYVDGNPTGYTMACSAFSETVNNDTEFKVSIDPNIQDGPTGIAISMTPHAYFGPNGESIWATSASDGFFTGVAGINMTVSSSGSGNIYCSGSVNYSTITTNTNSLKFVFPRMDGATYSETRNITQLFNTHYEGNNNKFIIAFISNNQTTGSNLISWFKGIENYQSGSWVFYPIEDYPNFFHYVYSGNIPDVGYLTIFEVYDPEHVVANGSDSRILWSDKVKSSRIIPIYAGIYATMSDGMYRYLYRGDRQIDAINYQGKAVTDKQAQQIAQDKAQHEEAMNTSDVSKLPIISNDIKSTTETKMGDLLFPIQHVIDTADELANVNATGQVRLPAIFAEDEFWILDLTVIERNLPEAWTFIQSLCQLTVAIYMIHGLYSLISGGTNDS